MPAVIWQNKKGGTRCTSTADGYRHIKLVVIRGCIGDLWHQFRAVVSGACNVKLYPYV
jgi:hypothetical protein